MKRVLNDFNLFRNKNQNKNLDILYEQNSSSNEETSWWRISNDSEINKETIISRGEVLKDQGKYLELIEEIQIGLSRIGCFNNLSNGVWTEETSSGIKLVKNLLTYSWESGSEGNKICKSFYKYLVYNSGPGQELFSKVFLEVIQRPKIIQVAWEDDPDNYNKDFTKYSQEMIDGGRHVEVRKEDWQFRNSFKEKNRVVVSDICRTGLIGKWNNNNEKFEGDNYFDRWFPNDQEYIKMAQGDFDIKAYHRMLSVLKEMKVRDKGKLEKLKKK